MVEVLKTGLLDTIQDLGRFGFSNYGVPASGVMDRYSALLGNSILGNDSNAAVIESIGFGPHLKFSKSTLICVTGAIMNSSLDDVPIKNNVVIKVDEGSILRFGKLEAGCRVYISVFGGFQTEIIMNSRSMYRGVTSHEKLMKGDVLPILGLNKKNIPTFSSVKTDANHFKGNDLEVFKGPEFDFLSTFQQERLFNTLLTVSKESNRMAYQFDEPFENDLKSIITSLVLPGTAQLTPSGKLIVLMRDCQITGGYPRVLQLTEKSISKLSQQFTCRKIALKRIN